MNDNAKKAGLIVIVVVALAGAVYGAMQFFGGEKMQVEKVVPMPEGYKSEKQRMLDEQAAGQVSPQPGKAGGGDRDLGGDIRGGG
jgi:hypothetical protein